jgi:hypothetical protein
MAGLLDYAMLNDREDPHTLAHLGAMYAMYGHARPILTRQEGRSMHTPPIALQREFEPCSSGT